MAAFQVGQRLNINNMTVTVTSLEFARSGLGAEMTFDIEEIRLTQEQFMALDHDGRDQLAKMALRGIVVTITDAA